MGGNYTSIASVGLTAREVLDVYLQHLPQLKECRVVKVKFDLWALFLNVITHSSSSTFEKTKNNLWCKYCFLTSEGLGPEWEVRGKLAYRTAGEA